VQLTAAGSKTQTNVTANCGTAKPVHGSNSTNLSCTNECKNVCCVWLGL